MTTAPNRLKRDIASITAVMDGDFLSNSRISIDRAKTFRAAKIGGVKNYFVEQNWALTKESVAFLKGLKV